MSRTERGLLGIARAGVARAGIARIIGVSSAALSCIFLIGLTKFGISRGEDANATMIFVSACLLSMGALYAALTLKPWLLIVLFVISFFPFGLYLSLWPTWYRMAGIMQLGYPIASILMFRLRRSSQSPPPRTHHDPRPH
jgi:hypothetical protein